MNPSQIWNLTRSGSISSLLAPDVRANGGPSAGNRKAISSKGVAVVRIVPRWSKSPQSGSRLRRACESETLHRSAGMRIGRIGVILWVVRVLPIANAGVSWNERKDLLCCRRY